MNRLISAVSKRINSKIVLFRLQHGLYKKVALPKADIGKLYEKWEYVNPECVKRDYPFREEDDVALSICIPMYNVESLIQKLLQEIANQVSAYSYEVILVDDGSTDNTAEIVKKFIEGKSNFHLISQQNAGISSARNKGIEQAKGTYITFIDSDDEISKDYIEKLMTAAINQNADIVNGRYYLKRKETLHPRGLARGYIWGGVMRRSLFKSIRFPVGYWFEDMINLFLVVPLAKKVTEINDYVIYHNDVEGSASKIQNKAKNYKALEQLYLVMSLTEDFYKIGLTDKDYLSKRLITECGRLMVNRTSQLDEDTQKQVFLACNQLFLDNEIEPGTFAGVDKLFANAIINKDFTAWKMAADII